MILRILRPVRHAGWVALVAACAVSSACSSSSSAPVPATYIAATVGAGDNGQVCNLGVVTQWLNLGESKPSADLPTLETNGSTVNGNGVNVQCTVATSGNGFDIALSAIEQGSNGGTVVITSPVGMGAVTQAGATGITAGFESSTYGEFRETDCTIAFTYGGSPITGMPSIAAGRIFGHLSCPRAQQAGVIEANPDGGAGVTDQCDAEADFLFQNCQE